MKIRFWLLIILLFFSISANADIPFAQRPDVQKFFKYMVKKYHFKEAELTSLFNSVNIRPKIIQKLKTPFEQKPWYFYQRLFVTEWRIRQGVEFWKKHKDALQRAEQIYGVPASIIVATIGVETKYGQSTGEFRVIDALTNLAFGESGRSNYFKKELEQFLLLSREQHLDPLSIMGSYAGAIGQPQFMPSSYRHYAVNFSGSGKIDLSNDETDVIGSIANYYSKHGWKRGEAIAVPASFNGTKYTMRLPNQRFITKSELLEAGVVPNKYLKSKVIELQGYYGNEYWLGFPNFDVIKRYNTSNLYAMAVFQLSYYISELREKSNYAYWT